ncbi:hypothetical protein [Pedobacter sp.]|uniref:hypothetical protein n=1 Tax=Pedobacter sp. TaxID=1411316 RepID=UPI003D7FDB08
MKNKDERSQANMFMMVSLDKNLVLIKNEGKSIARNVRITIESHDQQPILVRAEIEKAQINYMPDASLKLQTNPLSKGYFKTTVTWADDFRENNEQVFHLYR